MAVAEILVVIREREREQLTTFSCRGDGVKILNKSAAAEIFGGVMCGTSVRGVMDKPGMFGCECNRRS